MAQWFLRKYLNNLDLAQITSAVAVAEQGTLGEIRVAIRHRRHWRERKLTLHELTVQEFQRMGMQKTAERSGVLILLLISERKFHIVADEGIHLKVADGTWESVASSMGKHFKSGQFRIGIIQGVETVGKILAEHFPRGDKKGNELTDEVDVS
jgi:uncharacterized membrane protein